MPLFCCVKKVVVYYNLWPFCSRESKRKTAAVVALRNDERLFGDAALNTVRKRERERERERERIYLCALYVVRKVINLCTRWSGLSRKHKTKQEGSLK